MNRKKEISNDIWIIMQGVYSINAASDPSEKQAEFLQKVVEYIDTNLSTRRKKLDSKDKK
jgi:hypothetical protein